MNPKSETFQNLRAIFLGIFIAIIAVIIIDKIFLWSMNVKVTNSRFFAKADDFDGLGWTARNDKKLKKTYSGYSSTHKEEFNGNVIFDVTYNFDSLYRRRVEENPVENAKTFVIFFGDSQTFGEGLNDWETIPAIVQQGTSSRRVYNYAYSGYGPHQMLKKIETHTLKNEVPEKRGIAFFQYFGFHVQRVIGSSAYIGWAGGGAPYYEANTNGQTEYLGSFATGRFFKTFFYWLLSKSAIATYLRIDLPAKITHHHRDLVCGVLEKSRRLFHQQFPDSRFVVIVGMTEPKSNPIVEECLEKNNIEYVDMRGTDLHDQGLAFPHNGHFTSKAAQLIARQLLPLIGK